MKEIKQLLVGFENCDSVLLDWVKYECILTIGDITEMLNVVSGNQVSISKVAGEVYFEIPKTYLLKKSHYGFDTFGKHLEEYKDISWIGIFFTDDSRMDFWVAWENGETEFNNACVKIGYPDDNVGVAIKKS
jgi:hypothetical protein